MVTKGDKIAFSVIAILFILALVFRKDIASAFNGNNGQERKEKKDKKDKDKDGDKKEGRRQPAVPAGAHTVWYAMQA